MRRVLSGGNLAAQAVEPTKVSTNTIEDGAIKATIETEQSLQRDLQASNEILSNTKIALAKFTTDKGEFVYGTLVKEDDGHFLYTTKGVKTELGQYLASPSIQNTYSIKPVKVQAEVETRVANELTTLRNGTFQNLAQALNTLTGTTQNAYLTYAGQAEANRLPKDVDSKVYNAKHLFHEEKLGKSNSIANRIFTPKKKAEVAPDNASVASNGTTAQSDTPGVEDDVEIASNHRQEQATNEASAAVINPENASPAKKWSLPKFSNLTKAFRSGFVGKRVAEIENGQDSQRQQQTQSQSVEAQQDDVQYDVKQDDIQQDGDNVQRVAVEESRQQQAINIGSIYNSIAPYIPTANQAALYSSALLVAAYAAYEAYNISQGESTVVGSAVSYITSQFASETTRETLVG